MPIYEYECPQCEKVFEEWGKTGDSHKNCPICGTDSPRIISRTSFVLKGDGWYVSDYGYRKGITEEGGKGASTPAKSKPTTPARQTDKTLATQTSRAGAGETKAAAASSDKKASAPDSTANSSVSSSSSDKSS